MGRALQTALLILLTAWTLLPAQVVEEEGELVTKDVAPPKRTQNIALSSSYYLNTLKSSLQYTLTQQLHRGGLKQQVHYLLDYDRGTEVRQQQLDLRGSRWWQLSSAQVGVEWVPTFFANEQLKQEARYGVVSFSVGPLYRDTIWAIPFAISGGYAHDVWHDSLRSPWVETPFSSRSQDGGGYFSVTAGSAEQPLFRSVPFWSYGSIDGRYMSESVNSNVTSGTVTLHYADSGRFGADVVDIRFTDPLVNGRPGPVVGYSGDLVSTPVRIENVSALSAKLGGIGKGAFEPSLSFQLSQSQFRYPYEAERAALRERWFTPELSVVRVLSDSLLTMKGRFQLGLGKEQNAYDYDSSEVADSLLQWYHRTRLNDKELLRPLFGGSLRFAPTPALALTYEGSVERERKQYPYTYESVGGRAYSVWSRDMQTLLQQVGVEVVPTARWELEGDVSLRRTLLYYLHSEQSGASYKQLQLSLSGAATHHWDSLSSSTVELGGYAEPKYYLYDDSTHNREFFGRLSGEQALNRALLLSYGSRLSHFDRGALYADRRYGITEKRRELSGELALRYRLRGRKLVQQAELTAGSDGKYQHRRYWEFSRKAFSDPDEYLQISPHFSLKMLLTRSIFVDLGVRRYLERGSSTLDDYWDIAVKMQVGGS